MCSGKWSAAGCDLGPLAPRELSFPRRCEHLFTSLIGPLALVVLVTVACLVPMKRALSVDPVILLREQ
jgi:hypothetical protein